MSKSKKITKIGDLASRARYFRFDNGFILYKRGSAVGEYFSDFLNYAISRNFNIELLRGSNGIAGYVLIDHNTGITYDAVPNIERTKYVYNLYYGNIPKPDNSGMKRFYAYLNKGIELTKDGAVDVKTRKPLNYVPLLETHPVLDPLPDNVVEFKRPVPVLDTSPVELPLAA